MLDHIAIIVHRLCNCSMNRKEALLSNKDC